MNEIRVLTPLLQADISVIVATFGDDQWAQRGLNKALDTFMNQVHVPETIWVHDETLAKARNHGAELATTDWLVFLDADDELDPFFCSHIPGRTTSEADDGDILQTSVRGYRDRTDSSGTTREWLEPGPAFFPKRHPLIRENYLIIGSPIRSDLFRKVEGFEEWSCLEDWELWLRCEKAGAKFGQQPLSVYLINDSHDRNYGPPQNQVSVAQEIRKRYQ